MFLSHEKRLLLHKKCKQGDHNLLKQSIWGLLVVRDGKHTVQSQNILNYREFSPYANFIIANYITATFQKIP